MPYFNAGPGIKTLLVSAGSKTYLLGSVSPVGGKFAITNVALNSNVATVTVTGYEGIPPVVGTPISIRGTSNGAGEFNVTAVPVTAVSLDQTGAGTISFALTGSNLGTTADSGYLTFDPIVTGETVVAGNTIAGALARPSAARSQNSVFAQLSLPVAGVTALTAAMQVSDDLVNWLPVNNNAGTAQTLTVTAGAPTNYAYFETTALYIRAAFSGLTGSGPAALVVSL